jgi:hypothetical protein
MVADRIREERSSEFALARHRADRALEDAAEWLQYLRDVGQNVGLSPDDVQYVQALKDHVEGARSRVRGLKPS